MKKVLVFILLIISLFYVAGCTTKNTIQETVNNGNIIIQGLDDYYTQNHNYPNTIEQLVPKYLNAIPKAKTFNMFYGRSIFVYRPTTSQINTYEIRFYDYTENKAYVYFSEQKTFENDNNKSSPKDADIIYKITKDQINCLIEAIDKYYLENHIYPIKIENLIPNYLHDIPFTQNGSHKGLFNYTTQKKESSISNNEYELFFKYNLFSGYYYNSIDRTWKGFKTLI